MKSRGNRKMLLSLALMGTLAPALLHAEEDSANGFLRRHRLQESNEGSETYRISNLQRERRTKAADQGLEDLWKNAAATAQVELDTERILQFRGRFSEDFSMSMPSAPPPSRHPTKAPVQTPAPIPGQTPSPTPRPTGTPPDCLQGKTKEEYIFDLLERITSGNILNDDTTPQGRAFDYMVNEDAFLENPCAASTIEQRYALITLYYATEGANWDTQTGWLGSQQECSWFGVECPVGELLASRVTLSNNNLIGSIPNEVSALFTLERISVFANALFGTIPQGISNLTQLILLDLEENLLTGPSTPTSLFDLDALIAYRVSDNSLTGTISSRIGTLSNLEQLWIAENPLTDTIPSQIASLTKLESLFLYESGLQGALPTEFGTLTGLQDLRVYGNQLQGFLPTQLFDATNLMSLRLELNFFSGLIPSEIGNLVNLEDFRIYQNSLSGALPSEIGRLTLLENLLVNNNFFSGQIPNVFQDFERLDFFDAANAAFSGPIPESLFSVDSIRLVYLSNNTLTGTIPSNYAEAPLLRDLFLDGNGLVGMVPSILPGQLPDLNEFLLHFNFLTGTMPGSVCNLRGNDGNLEDLFSDCGGQDPEILCDFPDCCNRCFEGGSGRRLQERGATGRSRRRVKRNAEVVLL